MTCKCARYDAWGNKILPRDAMLLYYKDDPQSTNILKRYMPHRYVCIPAVEILIDCQNPGEVDVYLIYPGETKLIEKSLSERAVEALRATYRGKPGWTVTRGLHGAVKLRREGRVIIDAAHKFGWRG